MRKWIASFTCVMMLFCGHILAQSTEPTPPEHLQLVIVLSRHGVRSPIGPPGRLNRYSAAPWPKWDVPSGYLTHHGFTLMKLFGAYYREEFSQQGLLASSGCGDQDHVTFLADRGERTLQTGIALAEGMFPGCRIPVRQQPSLFQPRYAAGTPPDRALEVAAVKGQVGGNLDHLTELYRPQLRLLDQVLAGCGKVPATNPARLSIFDVPSAYGSQGQLDGPTGVASSVAENLLLEYTDGRKTDDLGWGCVDKATLLEIMQIYEAHVRYHWRTRLFARADASELLDRITDTLEQGAAGKEVAGAIGKPQNRLLVLAWHDGNIATVAGALGLHWIVDGMQDGTPPGGALLFELWRARDGKSTVRLYYTAQSLDQMRSAQKLTTANPPERVPVFVPGCSGSDMACSLADFDATVRRAIIPARTVPAE